MSEEFKSLFCEDPPQVTFTHENMNHLFTSSAMNNRPKLSSTAVSELKLYEFATSLKHLDVRMPHQRNNQIFEDKVERL